MLLSLPLKCSRVALHKVFLHIFDHTLGPLLLWIFPILHQYKMIPGSDVFLQCDTDVSHISDSDVDTFLCAATVCLSVDFETAPALANTVQGSLAGIRVCEHTAAKRSHRPAYHLHDNPLTAHQVMMTGNAHLPLTWHLHYLLVSSTVFPRPLSPTLITYSLS